MARCLTLEDARETEASGQCGTGRGCGGGGEGGARRGTVLLACTTCRVAVTGCLTFENVRETEATEQGGKRTVLLL